VDPLLVNLVRYANDIKASFEPLGTGCGKQKKAPKGGSSQYGGPYGKELEVPVSLWEALKGPPFPAFDFR
jgi:hypothetical protein